MSGIKISAASVATIEALRSRLTLTGLIAGSFTTVLPTVSIATDRMYAFAGAEGAVISTITWHNGDFALYNGTWTRIPYQSVLANQMIIVNASPFYLSGILPVNATSQTVTQAIKSLVLEGNWNKTKNYAITYISRNSATDKWRLIIKEVNTDGSFADTSAYDSLPYMLTEAGVGKTTKVVFPDNLTTMGIRRVIVDIDYNQLTTGVSNNIQSNAGMFIKPSNISFIDYLKDEYPAFINANFGFTNVANHFIVFNAIKNIQLIGDWNVSSRYIIRYISRNHLIDKWRIIIEEVNEVGVITVTSVYDSKITVTEQGVGKYTLTDWGLKGSKRVVAVIDWNLLVVGNGIPLQTTLPNYILKPSCISPDYPGQVKFGNEFTNVAGLDYLSENNTTSYNNVDPAKLPIAASIVNKKGFISFRTDDNHILEEVSSIFDKFGYRYTLAINLGILDYVGQESQFINLQGRGYELADHTPNHNTTYFDIPSKYLGIFTPFLGNGLLEIIDIGSSKHRCSLELNVLINYTDVKFGATNAFQTVSGTSNITGDFSTLRQITSFPTYMEYAYIETPNGTITAGWYLVSATTTGQITIAKANGQSIAFSSNNAISIYIVQSILLNGVAAVTLGDNATYCLLLASQLWAHYYGLNRFRTFIQPGGDHPWLNNASLERILDKLGMHWAETMNDIKNLTYNYQYTYTNQRTGTWWEGSPLHLDSANQSMLQHSKELISDYIATNQIRTLASHYRWSSFTGATDPDKKTAYINHIHNLIEWCFQQNIPLVTLENRKRILLDSEINANSNVMPELYFDRAGRNKPDGYILDVATGWQTNGGRAEDKGCCLRRTGNGGVFSIASLGGLEKGANEFSFWAKGVVGTAVAITLVTLQTVTLDSADWKKYSIKIDAIIMDNFYSVALDVSNNSGDFYISAMKLRGV
jgi:hypothetical protein